MIDKDTVKLNDLLEDHLRNCRLKIGEEIKKIREKNGYSQEHLANIMKVSRTTISKIENGKFNFSIDYLSKFSWVLDFDLSIIVSQNTNNKKVN